MLTLSHRKKIYEQWHRQYSRAESQTTITKNYSSYDTTNAFQISEMNKLLSPPKKDS